MALIKCKECEREISTEASACPGCGAPVIATKILPKTKYYSLKKAMSWKEITFYLVVGLGVVTWLSSGSGSKDQTIKSKARETPKEIVDYSLLTWTTKDATVCPISILLDKREGMGLEGASEAAQTIFGRDEAFAKVGCEQWKEGIPVYVKAPQAGQLWQLASTSKGAEESLIVLSFCITNYHSGEKTKLHWDMSLDDSKTSAPVDSSSIMPTKLPRQLPSVTDQKEVQNQEILALIKNEEEAAGHCKMMDLDDAETTKACNRRDALWEKLKSNGKCFNQTEQKWHDCLSQAVPSTM